MNVLWECEHPESVRCIRYKMEEEYAYTTIMTELGRLYKKKFLKRNKTGKTYYYKVILSKETFAKEQLRKVYEELISNYGELVMFEFIEVLKEDKENLRKFVKYLNNKKF